MTNETEVYTSECGTVSVSMAPGLDRRTVAKLLTDMIHRQPDAIQAISGGLRMTIGFTPVPSVKSFTYSAFYPLDDSTTDKARAVIEQNRAAGVYDSPCVVVDTVTGKVW